MAVAHPARFRERLQTNGPVYANIRSLREYGYMVTEHDPARPWLILGREHHTIELPEGELFFDWASREWPAPRFSVQLDPWALEPD